MSKTKKITPKKQVSKDTFLSKFDFGKYIPLKYQTILAIVISILFVIIFFNPMFFNGKTFQSGDIITIKSMQPYLTKDRDSFSLWNPLVFCGMPAYAFGSSLKWFNLLDLSTSLIRKFLFSPCADNYIQWTLYLIVLAITSFVLMKSISKNNLISLFTSVATTFTTGYVVFLYIGHVTKLTSLAWLPLIFLLLLKFNEKIRFINFLALIILLQLFIQGFHVQIIFYTLFAVAIYFIFYFIRALVKKDITLRNNLIKSAVVFVVSSLIAVAISSDNLTQIYEYSPYSTRGTKSIVEEQNTNETMSKAQYYEYHTNWSFSPGEVLTFIIPSYYGFGNVKYQGPLSNNQEVEVNTYFGQMPFVDVAQYMGIIVFFLALFGIFTCWKEPFVKYLTILSIIALFISFGKTFPVLFDLMFYNFPFFDRFRVPSMILVLVQFSFPILAGYVLMKIISLRNEKETRSLNLLKYTTYIFSSIFIIGLLANNSINSWMVERVNNYASTIQSSQPQLAQQFTALADFIGEMFVTDFLIGFALLSITFFMALFYTQNKISRDILVLVIIVLCIIDLWRIDSRGANFVDAPNLESIFKEPEYIKVIKEQNDNEPHRLFNLKQDRTTGSFSNNSNFNAYFLQEDFYGYSGIKPRSYQNIMDVVGPFNETLWRMLNVKYLIFDQPINMPNYEQLPSAQNAFMYKNLNSLPRFYFVDSVSALKDIDILNNIKSNSFDPKKLAFIDPSNSYIIKRIEKPDSTASIKLLKYSDETIELEVNASGNNFLFLGNTYLPTGWKVFIDNNKNEIYKTNHGFIGTVIPKGKHNVKFVYAPTSFYISQYTSLTLSYLTVIGFIVTLLIGYFKKKKATV